MDRYDASECQKAVDMAWDAMVWAAYVEAVREDDVVLLERVARRGSVDARVVA